MEPRPGLEPGTCRLRNGRFLSIPFLFIAAQYMPFGVVWALSDA